MAVVAIGAVIVAGIVVVVTCGLVGLAAAFLSLRWEICMRGAVSAEVEADCEVDSALVDVVDGGIMRRAGEEFSSGGKNVRGRSRSQLRRKSSVLYTMAALDRLLHALAGALTLVDVRFQPIA
ncbi:hypothetical protein BOTBODRAFT_47193 [Botryobasidium botryosum FD-172 SS1]|uniref:Uncharacterized protein n=1 Tax=Botryobasidium botryosum (strain FD-172 SS1) TaxID=930990 RepID=A0A067M3P8_BOTB1|nr:hypothetical protein BOTBODRAFT_47193 [Botryobasidium botryosum FD-172 SS1]